MKLLPTAAIIPIVLCWGAAASAQNYNLTPSYKPQPPSIENFKAPPPLPTTYPNIRPDPAGEPRLNVNKDVSLGGDISAKGVSGNVRMPLPKGLQ